MVKEKQPGALWVGNGGCVGTIKHFSRKAMEIQTRNRSFSDLFFSYVEFILKFKFINYLFSRLISDSVSGEKEKLRSFE